MATNTSRNTGNPAPLACSSCLRRPLDELTRRPLTRRAFTAGGLAAAGMVGLSACSVNPATGRYTVGSIDDDVSTGKSQHPQILQAFGGA